jgi:uncharacterized protein YsxB (DUF464 family)
VEAWCFFVVQKQEVVVVTIEVLKDGVNVVGHAKYAERGKDIVCSAVSTLFQSFVLSMEKLTKDKVSYTIKAGESYLTHETLSNDGRLLKNAFLLAVREVSEGYPNHVALEYKESL